MARLSDTLINNQAHADEQQSKEDRANMVNLTNSGQNGPMLNYRGYVGNAPYVSNNLIAVLVEAPTGFQQLEDPDHWVATLKSLVELHARSIEGLNSTVNVEMSETAIGGAGEMQESPINVTRERSVPVFTWDEKYGKPIKAFLEGWIFNLIMDPETKYPRVVTNGDANVADLLPDFMSMTVLFFEPDPTFTSITEAYLSTNMMPKSGGENTSTRDLTTSGETREYGVEFSAITQVGLGVKRFAQEVLDQMNTEGMNPNLQPAFVEEINANVQGDAAPTGYSDRLNAAAEAVISQ